MFQATEKSHNDILEGVVTHQLPLANIFIPVDIVLNHLLKKKNIKHVHIGLIRLLWSTDPPTILINRHSSDTSDIVRRHGRMYEHTYTHTHARTHTWYSWGMKLSMMSICSRSSRLKWRMFSSRPSISLWCSCWRSAICTMEDKRHVMGNGVCDI